MNIWLVILSVLTTLLTFFLYRGRLKQDSLESELKTSKQDKELLNAKRLQEEAERLYRASLDAYEQWRKGRKD